MDQVEDRNIRRNQVEEHIDAIMNSNSPLKALKKYEEQYLGEKKQLQLLTLAKALLGRGFKNIKYLKLLISRLLRLKGEVVAARNQLKDAFGNQYKEIDPSTFKVFSESEYLQKWADRDIDVSIICPTYNHEAYIEDCLAGIFSQDVSYRFELLIHDDASSDRTAEIINRWVEKYPKIIRFTHQKENIFSKGMKPLDEMFEISKGRYIALCEGDDYWVDKDKLQTQVDFLDGNSEYVCCTHGYYNLNEISGVIKKNAIHVEEYTKDELMTVTKLMYVHTLVFRKVVEKFPEIKKQIYTGDLFIASFLGHFGKAKVFGHLFGSVARKNSESIWTPKSRTFKVLELVKSRIWIAEQQKIFGNGGAAAKNQVMAYSRLLELVEPDNALIVLKQTKKLVYQKVFQKTLNGLGITLKLPDFLRNLGLYLELNDRAELAVKIYELALLFRPGATFMISQINKIKNDIENNEQAFRLSSRLGVKVSDARIFRYFAGALLEVDEAELYNSFIEFVEGKLKVTDKVFIIGQNKTGTAYLKQVFEDLGTKIGSQYRGEQLIWDLEQGDFSGLKKLCESAQVFQDIPFSMPKIYEYLYEEYPDAYFILLERDNENEWFDSLIQFHKKLLQRQLGTSEFTKENLAKFVYSKKAGYFIDTQRIFYRNGIEHLYDEKSCKKSYSDHLKDAKSFFAGNDRFITLNLNNSNSQKRLADFLGVIEDFVNIPHLNRTK